LHVTEAFQSTKLALCLVKTCAHPAQHHRGVSPATDVAREVHHRAVEILDGVGTAKRAVQRVGNAEALKSEGLFESLPQRSCRSRMLALQRADQALELAPGEIGIGSLVGLLHRAAHAGLHRLGEMLQDVSSLV